jgi:hypothetical protein
MATDVAFAIGVLALLGDRVPAGARLFLLSIAIVDDLIAIAVITVFYSAPLTWGWLAVAAAGLVAVAGLRRMSAARIWPYALTGLLVWYASYKSGIHATVAGVALALLTPARPFRGRHVLTTLEHRLHPVSAWAVVPVFALANAGVDLRGGLLTQAATSRLAWAVAAGLIAGKTIGIAAVTLAAVRARLGLLPAGVKTGHVWGLSAVAGIGFTVSLFITGLAYQAAGLVNQAKVGIFAGSLASGTAGIIILLLSRRGPDGLKSRSLARRRGPAGPALHLDADYRAARRGGPVLGVAGRQQGERGGHLGRAGQERGGAVGAGPPQPVPVRLVVVGEHGHPRLGGDVAQPRQPRGRLRLGVDRAVDHVPVHRERDRDDVGAAARAHRGQAGDGGGGEPPPGLGRLQVQLPLPRLPLTLRTSHRLPKPPPGQILPSAGTGPAPGGRVKCCHAIAPAAGWPVSPGRPDCDRRGRRGLARRRHRPDTAGGGQAAPGRVRWSRRDAGTVPGRGPARRRDVAPGHRPGVRLL